MAERQPSPTPAPSDREIDGLLVAALDLETEQRLPYLRQACGGDPELFERVAAILAAGEETDPLLRPGGARGPTLLEALPDREALSSGALVGRYRVLHEIGRGGMGVVYLAERADGHFEHRVALKVLPPGAGSAALDRFARERQILADLEHPNIARLLDGGLAAGGIPYLVMDLVTGVAIDRHCREGGLGLRRRIELLIEVCTAVEAAHRRLIVHRDLKPSNILVTREGQVRLLDFGIAKLLEDGQEHGAQGGATLTAARLLTPQYASPEQIRGEAITVASDVYQLGLLAFELFTERRPYELSRSSAVEAERKICLSEPPRPSTLVAADELGVASGGRLRSRDLAGDLDTIVLKALRKEPERRYGSVAQLREDLERHLAGFPVSARPDTWSYRLGKLMRRHGLALSAASLAGLLLVASAATFTWRLARERDQTRLAAQRAEEQRLEAEQRREETEEVVDFLVGLFEISDPYADRVASAEPSARDLLRWGNERLETTFADRPLIRARLMHTTGRIYSRMELFDEAEPLLRGALALREAVSEDPADGGSGGRDQRLEIAELEHDLGLHYTEARRVEQAETSLRRALELRREVLGEEHELVAESSVALANLLHRRGRYDESEALLHRAVTIYDGLATPPSEQRVVPLLRLGQSRLERGAVGEAREYFERALALARERRSANDPMVASALKSLARCAAEEGELEASLPLFQESLEIFEHRFGADSIQASNVRQNIAFTLYALGQTEEAFRLFREALATVEAAVGEHSMDALALRFNLTAMRLEQGDPAGAEVELRRLQPLLRAQLGPSHKLTLLNDLTLARALTDLGRYREAEALLRPCLEALEATFGPQGQYVGQALVSLARIHRQRGEPAQAEPLLRRALEIGRATMKPGAPDIAKLEAELAELARE